MKNISKRVYEVLIGNTFVTPSAGALDPSTLTAGQLAVYDQNRDGGVTTADRYFHFAQADTNYGSRSSLPITILNISGITKTAYRAATNQVSTFTIAASDAQNSTVYVLEIVDKRNREYVNVPKYRYEFLSDSSATETEIATGFAAIINASTTAIVTATSSAGVLTLTGKSFAMTGQSTEFEYFEITPLINGGFTSASTVATTTAANRGAGTYEIVYEAEDGYKGYKGNMNRVEFARLATYYATSTKTYVTYTIRHNRTIDVEESVNSNANKSLPVTSFIYLDSTASASITAIDTFFNTTLGIAYS